MHAYILIRTFAKLDFEKYSIIPAYDFSVFGLYMGIIGASKTQNFIYDGMVLLKSLKSYLCSQMRTYFYRTIRVCLMSGINCKFKVIFWLYKNMFFSVLPSQYHLRTYLCGRSVLSEKSYMCTKSNNDLALTTSQGVFFEGMSNEWWVSRMKIH